MGETWGGTRAGLLGEDVADDLAAAEVAVDDALDLLGRAFALEWDSPAGDAFRARLGDVIRTLQRDGDALQSLRHQAARLRGMR